MTLWGFYRLAFARGWERSFDRARKVGFLIGLGAAIALSVAKYLRGPAQPIWMATGIDLAWLVTLAVLLLTLAYHLIYAPYQLYLEKARDLDSLVLAKQTADDKTAIRKALGVSVLRGQDLIKCLSQS